MYNVGADWLCGLLLLNNIALIILRQWISDILQIHWLLSPLNRMLKRLTDILLSLLFLSTIFPLTFIIQAVTTKRNSNGSILTFRKMSIGQKKNISGIVFRKPIFPNNNYIERLPLALNILIGSVSFWDLPILEYIADNTENFHKETGHTEHHINSDLTKDCNYINEEGINSEENTVQHEPSSCVPSQNNTKTDDWI